jgi:predicted metal-dependent hydrolase
MSGTRRVLLAAAREFNSRRFFEAHEVLEDGLEEIDEADWDLVLGLIQIAVGYHKASQGLWSGSLLMLGKGLDKVGSYPPEAATRT